MGSMSLMHWVIVIIVITLLFGRNVISSMMSDLGKGIRELKKINKDEENGVDRV